MNKKFINEIIKDDYKKWNKGDIVLLAAGTGKGKTEFIKTTLRAYALADNKRILYLTNRNNLKSQIQAEIGKDDSVIDIYNYQKLENNIPTELDLMEYDYVVCDEAHYFFTDASFNRKTDLLFSRLLNNKNVCTILMTATPTILTYYCSRHEINIDYKYELKTDYSYLDNVVAFEDYASIDKIINTIPEDEQIILFSSAKRAYEVAKKYNGAFICSKYNKDDMYKYVDKDELENIVKYSKFNNRLLCSTTVLDNGINIKSDTVKHIIIDVFDRDEFIQCLGRKRILQGEKVNLYFHNFTDNRRINGFKSKIVNSLDKADFLLEHGQLEYVRKKFKNDKFMDTRIIDDVIIDGGIHKVVNECMYTKFKVDLLMYNSILSKKSCINYKSIIALNLGIDKGEIIDMEIEQEKSKLEMYLDSIVGKRLYKEEQKELIDIIGLKDNRGRLQKSIKQLNAYLEANKLPYIIISKRVKENKKLKTIWMVENLIIEK